MKEHLTALVTGGAGFIGSNLVRLLLEKGCSVRVLDNLSSGYKKNIQGLDIEFIRGDVLDEADALRAVDGVDVVFHMAASVGRQRSIDHVEEDSMVNLMGTVRVLEAMRRRDVERIIYSSSAAIFGELVTQVIAEDHPISPDSPYGVSKLAAEKMILCYADLYGMTGVCLRYFNIFGVMQRYDVYGNVIPIFAHRLLNGEPLTIYGDGTQTRDFLNVRDVAQANYLAATRGIGTNVINLGSGTVTTIGELAQRMMDLFGTKMHLDYKPWRKGDVMHCRADTGRLKSILGFEAMVSLEEGLSEYCEWIAKEPRS